MWLIENNVPKTLSYNLKLLAPGMDGLSNQTLNMMLIVVALNTLSPSPAQPQMLSIGLLGGFAGLPLEQPGVRGRPVGPQACRQMDGRGGGPLAWATGALDVPLQGEVPAGEGEWTVSQNVWAEGGWEDLNTKLCLSFSGDVQMGTNVLMFMACLGVIGDWLLPRQGFLLPLEFHFALGENVCDFLKVSDGDFRALQC